jgi:hypothetical protein
MGEIFVSCIVLHNAGSFVGTITWAYLLSNGILIESILQWGRGDIFDWMLLLEITH